MADTTAIARWVRLNIDWIDSRTRGYLCALILRAFKISAADYVLNPHPMQDTLKDKAINYVLSHGMCYYYLPGYREWMGIGK